MTLYVHRWVLFAASPAAREAVRGLYAQFYPDDDPALFCATPLSPAADPTAPPGGWCASLQGTEPQRQALEAVESGGGFPPDLYYCRCDALTGRLVATNHPLWVDAVAGGAELYFDLAYTLEVLGLAFRAAEVENV